MSDSQRHTTDATATGHEDAQNVAGANVLLFTQSQIDAANQDILHNRVDLATLAGFEHNEIEALYARALEDLRRGLVDAATHRFLSLLTLQPKDARFARGLGLCYHYERNYGWATTLYALALKHDPDDGIAMALIAEATLYLEGKEQAHKMLERFMERGVKRPAELPYMQRARAIYSMIKL